MVEILSYSLLQHYWWIIVSLLAALLVFLMFVQGGQTLLGAIARDATERNLLINSLGRKWELTFTTLVVFGGALFAAFPLFYATSFGGAYWIWIILLFCFIIQAVSYEFRRKAGNVWGTRTYDTFLLINGMLATFLIGTVVGTFFTGSSFMLDAGNGVHWQHSLRGLEALFNLQNILLGFALFFLARCLGALYFLNNIRDEAIVSASARMVRFNAIPFLASFLGFLALLLSGPGFAYNPLSGTIYAEGFKYLNNLLEMPVVAVFFLSGVVLVVIGLWLGWKHAASHSIWWAGVGTVLTVFALMLMAGLNYTSFYPSTFDPQSSLTLQNSSSSHYTLRVMAYVSLAVPFVLAYIILAWRAIDRDKLDRTELENNDHVY